MSLDGPGIIDSDDAHDIYNEFMDLYDAGMEIPAIVESMLATRMHEWLDAFEEEIRIVALAQALWDTGGVPEEIMAILDRIIDSGESWEEWKNEDEDLARRRRRILLRFRKKIRQPRSKPRPRIKPMPIADLVYQQGECLTTRLATGEVAGFIVLEVFRKRGRCEYYLGFVEIAGDAEPSLESFRAGRISGGAGTPSSHFPDGQLFADTAVISQSELRSTFGSLVSAGSLELDDTRYMVSSITAPVSQEDLENAWRDRVVRASVWRTRSGRELLDLAPILKS